MVKAEDIRWMFWQSCFGVVLPEKVILITEAMSEDLSSYVVTLSSFVNKNGRKGRAIDMIAYEISPVELVSKGITKAEYFAEIVNKNN